MLHFFLSQLESAALREPFHVLLLLGEVPQFVGASNGLTTISSYRIPIMGTRRSKMQTPAPGARNTRTNGTAAVSKSATRADDSPVEHATAAAKSNGHVTEEDD